MTPGPWKAYSYEVVDAHDQTVATTATAHRVHDEERANAAAIARLPDLIETARMFVRRHAQIPEVPVNPDGGIGPEAGGCVCAYCARYKPVLALIDQTS
jgi:hypothetical protein